MPHKGSNPNYKPRPGHAKPDRPLTNAKRLRSPVKVSEKSGQALDEINTQRAAGAGTVAKSREILQRVGRRKIETVGGARRTSRDLAGVNRELRKQRGK